GHCAAVEKGSSDNSSGEQPQQPSDHGRQPSHPQQQLHQIDVSPSQYGESNPSFEQLASCQMNTKASESAYHIENKSCTSGGVMDKGSLENEKVVFPSMPTNHKSRKKRSKRKRKVLHHVNGGD